MIQRNCKNCGSPIEYGFNHKCKYCGTLYDFNEPEQDVVEVKPEDLINVELRYIERIPERLNILLMFDGYKVPMPKVYEYNDTNNSYLSKSECYINPPKCGFCIELPIDYIEKYGIGYIMDRIEATGIRYNEVNKIKSQLLNKINEFRKWGVYI